MTGQLAEKVKASIKRLQVFEADADRWSPDGKSGYYLAFSGGKDSVAVKRLMDMAGVKYEAHYRITSVDPPELVRFIREHHPDTHMDRPKYDDGKPITMWNLIPKKLLPPTRVMRYCCSSLKENGGNDRFAVTGVRWAESVNRKRNQGIVTVTGGKKAIESFSQNSNFQKTERGGYILVNDNTEARREIEACTVLHKMLLNPIIDWTDAEVWEFIRAERIPYCSLYDEGFSRIGCIGCPMAQKHGREREFYRWPKYKTAYLNAFQKMLEVRKERGLLQGTWKMGKTATDVFNWWMEYDLIPGQMDLLEDD